MIHLLERWTKHFRDQFTWPIVTLNLPLKLANETMQLDTSRLSEMEMIDEIGLLNIHKTFGPDGLSLSFFKDDTKALAKVLGSTGEENKLLRTDTNRWPWQFPTKMMKITEELVSVAYKLLESIIKMCTDLAYDKRKVHRHNCPTLIKPI